MSGIDFQNGFACGMATKGLVRSGELYKPICWNDEGVFSYFYINFRRTLETFSLGMLEPSIILHDSVQIDITGFTYISPGIYKIYCDIANRAHGVTVLNKETSLLSFATGEKVPAFSVHFFVNGIPAYDRLKYMYETTPFSKLVSAANDTDIALAEVLYENLDIPLESATYRRPVSANESIITLTLY